MVVAVHQPISLPWPGFFHKAVHSDCIVLLDDVQFPRGRSWLNRNRLKNEDGELWLTVPVLKKGRGLQVVRRAEIHNEKGWRRKHLGSIEQNYVNAPYFRDYFTSIEIIYRSDHSLLVELNLELVRLMWSALRIKTQLVHQSELGVIGTGTELLARICEHVGADRFLTFPMVDKHIDPALLRQRGIDVVHARFRPPVYPQLWGEFIYNLSTLDLLMNCGPKSREIVSAAAA